jgi:hypothetical protein
LGCCCRTEQSLVRNLNQGDRFTDHR